MGSKQSVVSIALGLFVGVSLLVSPSAFAKKRIVFGGGPAGGTFQVVANGIQVFKPLKQLPGFKVQAQSSAGSVENLRKTNSGRQQMSVVYSGHVWLGRNGKMKNDKRKYEDVLAVSYLYGAPAQLVTRKGSGITSVNDLVGKKVGVGNAGSGAFANCELFFTHMGVWDKIERNAMGYNDAAQAFGNNQLDAFWLFTAFPSGAVIMAAQTNDIELVNLDQDAVKGGFYNQYPYFAKLSIPGNTYKGVNREIPSFQDSTLWVANAKVPEDVVYKMLSLIYSDDGLKHMRGQKKTFKEMSVSTGTNGIVTPFHPGAERFWKEKGVLK
ncbi:MAG: TAXI family TRAP transporter solute-binding subunit [Desulfobacteraceae bacterium]|nr:TAXI family TRAP transporter solute-binding subunit [Desulfobacteraceae bacterium]